MSGLPSGFSFLRSVPQTKILEFRLSTPWSPLSAVFWFFTVWLLVVFLPTPEGTRISCISCLPAFEEKTLHFPRLRFRSCVSPGFRACPSRSGLATFFPLRKLILRPLFPCFHRIFPFKLNKKVPHHYKPSLSSLAGSPLVWIFFRPPSVWSARRFRFFAPPASPSPL